QVFADVKRAPQAVEQQIAALPGVADVETTVVFDVTLDIPEVAQRKSAKVFLCVNSASLRLCGRFYPQ
ncbi:MAG: hypothetical protein M1547_12960, partial [Gammaproteobacteria bacterium]|nr:hypothetical protein [Gammaproteobacteria bacterium]